MNTELCKVLDKLGVTAIVKDMPSIPARESTFKAWRVTLVRTVGRGKDAQELRLSTVFLGENRPLVHDVVECLVHDNAASEQKLWDFAQTFNAGKADADAEAKHLACRRIGKRAQKFFAEQWGEVTRAEQGIPAPAPVAKAKSQKRLKKTA